MNGVEFATVIKGLKAVYASQNFIPDEAGMNMWYAVLRDLTYQEFAVAAEYYIATRKFPPTPADIRGLVTDARHPEAKADWGKAWEQVLKAVRKYGMYQEADALASMDEITRHCVERMGWQQICISENQMADRANFRMIYEQVHGQAKEAAQLPPELKGKLKQLGGGSNARILRADNQETS